MRVKIIIAYDGSDFYGFQRQSDKITIQSTLEDALQKFYGADITVTPSGRTDEGVHALNQTVHFDTDKTYDDKKIVTALNFYLPQNIRVKDAAYVDKSFNARKSAKRKTYYYDMYISRIDNPLLNKRALRIEPDTDIELMKKICSLFLGQHDFYSFRCKGSTATTTIRNIFECSLYDAQDYYGERILRFQICGNGFLYKMVRTLAGTLINAGNGKLTFADIEKLLNEPSEYMEKYTAPPYALYLADVQYGFATDQT